VTGQCQTQDTGTAAKAKRSTSVQCPVAKYVVQRATNKVSVRQEEGIPFPILFPTQTQPNT